MKEKNQGYLKNLKDMYKSYPDSDSLNALAEVESLAERARVLRIYREQPKTLELIAAAITRYRTCLELLSNYEKSKEMTDADRAYCFATMDWAKFTLDIVGENPERLEQSVDEMVESYAHKAGLIH